MRNERGEITHFVATLRDITARVDEKLFKSEKEFRSLFELSAVGMARVSPEGRYLRVNRKLCDMLGYTEEDRISKAGMQYDFSVTPDTMADKMHISGTFKVASLVSFRNGRPDVAGRLPPRGVMESRHGPRSSSQRPSIWIRPARRLLRRPGGIAVEVAVQAEEERVESLAPHLGVGRLATPPQVAHAVDRDEKAGEGAPG